MLLKFKISVVILDSTFFNTAKTKMTYQSYMASWEELSTFRERYISFLRAQKEDNSVSAYIYGLVYVMNKILFLCPFGKLRNATISFVMSLCPTVRPSFLLSTWNNLVPTGRIYIKFDIWVFFKICRKKSRFI